jgi:ABC-type multidrug transport system ATPase subunit
MAAQLGLDVHMHKRVEQLSGGMRRRLQIAMALVGHSKLIVLDEPSSGLDPLHRRSLWQLIHKFKRQRTIIFTTHFMEGVTKKKLIHIDFYLDKR